MIDLKFVELHKPLFIAGTNMGEKLDSYKREGLQLQYDPEEEMLLVWYKDALALVPRDTVACMWPINIHETNYKKPTFTLPVKKPVEAAQANPKITAQVSGPGQHVFNGPGHGETGVGGRTK